jgi:hypothetical protein
MELTTATIEHLRDEAYAMLCRNAVTRALEQVEREKATIESTRPPFPFLASKHTRTVFEQSLAAVADNEAALRTRLGQVSQLECWLQEILHPELRDYLKVASPDYGVFAYADHLLNEWSSQLTALPEFLVAFSRDVRAAQEAAAPGARDLQIFAILRDTAAKLEAHLDQLDAILRQLIEVLPVETSAEIKIPSLPNFRHQEWVNRIAALPPEQLVAETTRVEAASRQFAVHGLAAFALPIKLAHDTCQRAAEDYLQTYWNQLRAHAQAHYVEDRDIDDVIAALTENYVNFDLARRQRELTTGNPFLYER